MAPLTKRTPALLDRADECESLRRLVDSARRGVGEALLAHGEAGIGKTALVEYAIGEARGLRIAHASGFEPETSLAYSGLHRLLIPTPAGIDRLPRPQREALTAAFDGAHGRSSSDRFLVGSAALALLAATIGSQPLLCVVDDAHWLDPESLEALVFIARRGIGGVAFLFVVREPVETRVRFDGIAGLYVGGLSSGPARALLTASMTTSVDESVLGRVIALTRGNPSTILELAAELSDRRAPGAPILPDTMPVGGRVERSFAKRVQATPSADPALPAPDGRGAERRHAPRPPCGRPAWLERRRLRRGGGGGPGQARRGA